MKFKFLILSMTLLFSTLIILTSCGTTEKTEVSDSTNAMSIIREYARTNGNTTEPTIKDYNDATVIGVDNNETLAKINEVLREDEIGADDIQAPTSIQTLLYERDILDTPASSGSSSPTISVFTPIPVVTTPPPVQTTPTPTPTSTPILTPIQGTPPIESNFKIEDKKGDISLTLKGEGNVTIEIGEEYDYENGYKVKDSDFNYLMGGIGINGETMDINASDYLVNKDKVGTYVIYYTLLDKKKKPILKIWRLVTVISSGRGMTNLSQIESYNGDHSTSNGITIKFKSIFPSNKVYVGDNSLNFDPKDFKATKDDGTDVTNYIMVKIIYNSSVISEYDKAKEGTYLFKYFFGDKVITKYTFIISKKETEPSPRPISTPTPTATQAPLSKTVDINDIELKLKYDETFTKGRKSRPIPIGFELPDPGYYFVNKKNGKRLYIITIQTKAIFGRQYVEEIVRDENGNPFRYENGNIVREYVPKPIAIGYNTKYGVSYRNTTIRYDEYNEGKGNIGLTILDENGNDVTNYLWQNLSIDSGHHGGFNIKFNTPTDGYVAVPYVLNRKGEMTNKYIFNNYEDESKNRTNKELEASHKKAKTPYSYVIRYVKAR